MHVKSLAITVVSSMVPLPWHTFCLAKRPAGSSHASACLCKSPKVMNKYKFPIWLPWQPLWSIVSSSSWAFLLKTQLFLVWIDQSGISLRTLSFSTCSNKGVSLGPVSLSVLSWNSLCGLWRHAIPLQDLSILISLVVFCWTVAHQVPCAPFTMHHSTVQKREPWSHTDLC